MPITPWTDASKALVAAAFGDPEKKAELDKLDLARQQFGLEQKKYGLDEAFNPHRIDQADASALASRASAGDNNAAAALKNLELNSQRDFLNGGTGPSTSDIAAVDAMQPPTAPAPRTPGNPATLASMLENGPEVPQDIASALNGPVKLSAPAARQGPMSLPVAPPTAPPQDSRLGALLTPEVKNMMVGLKLKPSDIGDMLVAAEAATQNQNITDPNRRMDVASAGAGKPYSQDQTLAQSLQSERTPAQIANLAETKARGGLPDFTAIDGATPGQDGSTLGDNQSTGFGFNFNGLTKDVYKGMVKNDSDRTKLEQQATPIMSNIERILDQLEPNLKNFQTGSMGGYRLAGDKALQLVGLRDKQATAGANIEKGTNDLATEISKLQYVPGMRASALLLQTILGSKPGVDQPPGTNESIMAGIRAKVADYRLANELNQKYREASPLRIVDSNADLLNQALKRAYPLETVDPKTGAVVFNPENAQKIQDAIPDAIANPQKYMSQGKQPPAPPGGNDDRAMAEEAIRQQPENAASIKAHYTERTGNPW